MSVKINVDITASDNSTTHCTLEVPIETFGHTSKSVEREHMQRNITAFTSKVIASTLQEAKEKGLLMASPLAANGNTAAAPDSSDTTKSSNVETYIILEYCPGVPSTIYSISRSQPLQTALTMFARHHKLLIPLYDLRMTYGGHKLVQQGDSVESLQLEDGATFKVIETTTVPVT